MGRYAKPVSQITGNHVTNEERERRQENEAKLRGKHDNIKPPKGTPKEVAKIFKSLVNEMKELEILNNLDVHVLLNVSYSLHNIAECRKNIAENGLIIDGKRNPAIQIERNYQDIFDKNGAKLGLSPADRMRFASLQLGEKSDDEIDMIFG